MKIKHLMGSTPSKISNSAMPNSFPFFSTPKLFFCPTHHNLDGKPGIADALDVEEEHVRIRLLFVDEPARGVIRCCNGDIPNPRNSHIRMSF